jgi:hypothetical protein
LRFGGKDIDRINKNFGALWQFTYKIINGYEPRIKAVNKDPENLLILFYHHVTPSYPFFASLIDWSRPKLHTTTGAKYNIMLQINFASSGIFLANQVIGLTYLSF